MEQFEKPVFEAIEFDAQDVIVTSGCFCDCGEYEYGLGCLSDY